MGRGDALASGAKRAHFFSARPQITNVEPFRDVPAEDLDKVSDPTSDSHLPALVDNSALWSKPHVQFRGKPRGDMVLVVRVEQKSASMLIVPDVAKGKSEIGRVAGVGVNVSDLSIGMLVMFDRFASVGNELKLVTDEGEVEHLLLRQDDVMLILEELAPAVP